MEGVMTQHNDTREPYKKWYFPYLTGFDPDVYDKYDLVEMVTKDAWQAAIEWAAQVAEQESDGSYDRGECSEHDKTVMQIANAIRKGK